MPILEAEELADLRREYREVLEEVAPDFCDVSRKSARRRNPQSPDEWVDGETVIYQNVPCYYRIASGRERLLVEKVDYSELFRVKIGSDFKVLPNDNLKIYAKGADAEITLRVVTVLARSNSITLNLLCAR